MNIIVACDRNFGIGNKGDLLCKLPEDLKHFKHLTMGKTVIMGKNTALSLPNSKPLKGRRNIVLTHNPKDLDENFETVKGIAELSALLGDTSHEDVWIIGGGQIYKLFLQFCDNLYITEIDNEFEADTYFPDYKSKRQWVENTRSKQMFTDDGISYSFVKYTRRKKKN